MHVSFSLVRGSRESYGASLEAHGGEKVFPFLPEKKLMIAVLEDAITCYLNHLCSKSISGKSQFEEAEKWFFHEHDDRLFSFINICLTIGLDPGYIRRGLLAARRAALGDRPPVRIYPFEKPQAPHAEGHVCAECAAKKRARSAAEEARHVDFRPA